MNLTNLKRILSRFAWLRYLRARLPYSLGNWRKRVANYWQWENAEDSVVLRNITGPSTTPDSIDTNRESIVWLLHPSSSDVCLDIGCGVGRIEKHLAPIVKEMHGVDFSQTMIERARARLIGLQNVHIHENDGQSLSMFEDGKFSLAWAELVFHHIPVEITRAYLAEIARVLANGGRFACQLPWKDFYHLHSRDVCGWMTESQARDLVEQFLTVDSITCDGRHILVLATKQAK